MNAEMEETNAAGMRVALTRKALTPVAAIPVSVVMGYHVLIEMSAQRVSTTVIGKRSVLTQVVHIAVLVSMDIMEMASSVKASKSFKFICVILFINFNKAYSGLGSAIEMANNGFFI